ncbi:hypothetical protein V8C44DRAFT_328417 [Trichoderma aethiopicum]
MPSINTTLLTAPEQASLISPIHTRMIIFYSSSQYHTTKYYIIASVCASIIITSLSIYLGFLARLHSGSPLRSYERYLFKSAIRKHERRQEEALAAQEEARRSAHASQPVNDVAAFQSHPHHMDGSHADRGSKSGSVQELIQRGGEEVLPAYEPPVGPPPSAVTR